MSADRRLLPAVFLVFLVAGVVAPAVIGYQEMTAEPHVWLNLRTGRMVEAYPAPRWSSASAWGWAWLVGVAVGIPVGLAYRHWPGRPAEPAESD